MSRRPYALLSATLLALTLALAPSIAASASPAAPAASAAHTYKNCTEIHKHWSGGSRPLKGTVKHSTAPYNANTKSDRDEDGVACEKSWHQPAPRDHPVRQTRLTSDP